MLTIRPARYLHKAALKLALLRGASILTLTAEEMTPFVELAGLKRKKDPFNHLCTNQPNSWSGIIAEPLQFKVQKSNRTWTRITVETNTQRKCSMIYYHENLMVANLQPPAHVGDDLEMEITCHRGKNLFLLRNFRLV